MYVLSVGENKHFHYLKIAATNFSYIFAFHLYIKILCITNTSKNFSESNEYSKKVNEKLMMLEYILHEFMDLIWYTVN